MNTIEAAGKPHPGALSSGAACAPAPADTFDVWIEAGRAGTQYWRDLWRYRELLGILAWRDVAVRYKQTIAGAAWAVLQPLVTLAVLTVIFGRVAGLPADGDAPYALMVAAGMLPWQFFANGLTAASQSVLTNAQLVSKVYFPRLIIPLSAVAVACVDFLVSGVIALGLMAAFDVAPTWRLLAVPPFMLVAAVAALGPGLLLTALTVRYRDVRFVVPFLVQLGLYASPIAYSSGVLRDRLGEGWFLLYAVNPMVGVIDGFRWAILGTTTLHPAAFAISLTSGVLMFVAGVRYFRATERQFADVI